MPITPEEEDWLAAYKAHHESMYYEAADLGYDFTGASQAKNRYLKAVIAYEQKHGDWKSGLEPWGVLAPAREDVIRAKGREAA
jgi:hypothetical protein